MIISLITSAAGLTWDQVANAPELASKRTQLVVEAASLLANTRMIAVDRQTREFTITDLGRIAAKYYIRYASIEIFNKVFRPRMSEADVLAMLCMSKEVCHVYSTKEPSLTRCSLIKYKSEKTRLRSSSS